MLFKVCCLRTEFGKKIENCLNKPDRKCSYYRGPSSDVLCRGRHGFHFRRRVRALWCTSPRRAERRGDLHRSRKLRERLSFRKAWLCFHRVGRRTRSWYPLLFSRTLRINLCAGDSAEVTQCCERRNTDWRDETKKYASQSIERRSMDVKNLLAFHSVCCNKNGNKLRRRKFEHGTSPMEDALAINVDFKRWKNHI